MLLQIQAKQYADSGIYEMSVDERDEVQLPDGSWDWPLKNGKAVYLEIHHKGGDDEHALVGVVAIHPDVTAQEVAIAVNDYLDLYCNPISTKINSGEQQ
jgi:hypothetical protein